MRPSIHTRARSVSTAAVALALICASCGSGGESGDTTLTTVGQTETQTSSDSTEPTTTTVGDVSASEIPDPCALLTPADLEAATGLTFGEGVFNESLSSDSQSICDWTSSGSEFATAQVYLAPDAGGVFDTAKNGAASAFTLVDIDVPGASAAYATEEGSISGMQVPGFYLQVSYIPSGPGNVLDATTELATEAVAALGG
ncbi:MAG: hypothetical protein WB245_00955 [Acidimicrobiia bacterium]